MLTYQNIVELREQLKKTCKLAQDSVRKFDIKQNAYYDKCARSRKFDAGDKVLLLLPNESNKLLLQWNDSYDVVNAVSRVDNTVNVKGVINTYPFYMLKQYVERDVISFCVHYCCNNVNAGSGCILPLFFP